jgi:hypothetical protein
MPMTLFPATPHELAQKMETKFNGIRAQLLSIICLSLKSCKNKIQEKNTGSLIFDLINQVPLSIELRQSGEKDV